MRSALETASRNGPASPVAPSAGQVLDLRGKTISIYVLFQIVDQFELLREGDSVTVLTDPDEALDNDLRAWCHATGTELRYSTLEQSDHCYELVKGPAREQQRKLAMVISDPGLERLLSPLGFALAAALEGIDVHLYIQGPAVRLLTRGFRETLPGLKRPFSRFARAGLARAGHVPSQEKLRQLRQLGARLYLCGPSMHHFRVKKDELIFDDLAVVEYATFMSVMEDADIHLFLQ